MHVVLALQHLALATLLLVLEMLNLVLAGLSSTKVAVIAREASEKLLPLRKPAYGQARAKIETVELQARGKNEASEY